MKDTVDTINTIAPTPLASAKAASASMGKKIWWRKNFGRLITLAQAFCDMATVFVCYMVSYAIYVGPVGGWSPLNQSDFMSLAAGASVLYVFILDRVGLYRREISLLNIKELRGIFYVGIYAAAVILSLSFYIRFISLSRITMTTAIIMAPVMLYLQRQFFYKIHVIFHQKGWSQKRVFIYGAGNIGTHLAKRMFESPSLGMYPIGFLDDDTTKKGEIVKWMGGPRGGVPVVGGQELIDSWRDHDVELVVIALPSASFDRNQKLVEKCVALGVDYSIVPNAYEKFIQHVEMFEIGGIPILRRRERAASYIYLINKRVLDFLLSSFFIIMLSPLIILIGLAIKINSKGPIIFKQKRVGLRGKEFSFYKFRSMYTEAPQYARTPSDPNDPRITRVGRWLRRTSLDELPQLFNVFRGDMSLVGPRPEMPFIVDTYSVLEKQRLEAKPGITGVWQISAVRGEPIHQNIEYDLFYLENRSTLLDLAVIVKTVISVVRGIGAI